MGYEREIKHNSTRNSGGINLEELIDITRLQALMDDFHALTGLPATIVDLNGKILAAVGWQEICSKFHRAHPESAKNCLESDLQLTKDITPGEFKVYRCKNKMWDIATPIVVDQNYLGNIYMGQLFFEDEAIDYEVFKDQAMAYNFNEDEYIAALKKVPHFTKEKVMQGMQFCVNLAFLISTQGYSNVKLKKSLGDLEKVKYELNTERDKLSSALNFQKEMMYTAAIWINTLDYQGNVTFWNRAAENISGYHHSEVLGHDQVWEWLYPDPDYRGKVMEKAMYILEKQERVDNYETVIKTKNGDERIICWYSNCVLKNGEVQGSIALGIDNTELKKAEINIIENEKRFHRMLKVIPDMVSIQDPEMNIIYSNWNGFGAVSPEKQVLNTKCYKTYRDYEQICPDCRAVGVLKTKKPFQAEYEISNNYWIDLRVIPLLDENGEVEYFIEWVRDISKLKEIEEQLKRLNVDLEKKVEERTRELENVNKELDAFTYSVSHDLRAPLRRIEGFSRIVLDEYSEILDQKGKDYLKRICLSTDNMKELIEDLLKLSRVSRQELNLEPVELSVLISIKCKTLQERDPERSVDFKISPEQVVEGDTALLKIAIENLLENAWKYTAGAENPKIEFSYIKQEEQKIFFITDNGAGFNMKYADKLFAPFQRLHSETEYSGSGIGLSIVARIINRHGGEIWAESEEGRGSTFYFTLP